ncbi:MAG: type II toxin-antitoxin system PemK/MazF family toxin [Candidatus Dormiibacterota bacterium]
MTRPGAGSIVLVDWRGGALPREPTKLRPAVVIEAEHVFPDDYPNLLVVPLTTDARLASALTERIEPDTGNGVTEPSWTLAPSVTSVSLHRVRGTESRVRGSQLASIRRQVGFSIGVSALT